MEAKWQAGINVNHSPPFQHLSAGCTGSKWKALFMSTFASRVPGPVFSISWTASSTVMYVSQTAKMGKNTIIYTETLGMGQVHNETPFVSLMMFGYHSKAVNIDEGAFFS